MVFSGEAPESDEEILAFSNVKLGTAQEVTEVYKPSPKRQVHREPFEGKSVLQKMLGNWNKAVCYIGIYSYSFLK